ncbi:MAG: hypothetical protein IPL53_05195 [Ignavibacteria bacterium]|nr:hypothetical protein [Ignavibacteria bacterium]
MSQIKYEFFAEERSTENPDLKLLTASIHLNNYSFVNTRASGGNTVNSNILQNHSNPIPDKSIN